MATIWQPPCPTLHSVEPETIRVEVTCGRTPAHGLTVLVASDVVVVTSRFGQALVPAGQPIEILSPDGRTVWGPAHAPASATIDIAVDRLTPPEPLTTIDSEELAGLLGHPALSAARMAVARRLGRPAVSRLDELAARLGGPWLADPRSASQLAAAIAGDPVAIDALAAEFTNLQAVDAAWHDDLPVIDHRAAGPAAMAVIDTAIAASPAHPADVADAVAGRLARIAALEPELWALAETLEPIAIAGRLDDLAALAGAEPVTC